MQHLKYVTMPQKERIVTQYNRPLYVIAFEQEGRFISFIHSLQVIDQR